MTRVLYYSCDPAWREQVRRLYDDIPGEVQAVVAATYVEAARCVKEESIDAVVVDPPDDEALPLLSLVREVRGSIPFILFTAPGREKIAIAAQTAVRHGISREEPPIDPRPRRCGTPSITPCPCEPI